MATADPRQAQERFPQLARVMVVDEHARVRQGLRLFLSTCPGMEVVAEAGGGGEALQQFARVLPDVVLMDLRMPGMDSPAITVHMKRLNPDSQVIALLSEADPDMQRRALAAGAFCCILKDSSTAALVSAIHAAHACVEAPGMTFVQLKTGVSTEWKSGAPSDGIRRVTKYDGIVTKTKNLRQKSCKLPQTKKRVTHPDDIASEE